KNVLVAAIMLAHKPSHTSQCTTGWAPIKRGVVFTFECCISLLGSTFHFLKSSSTDLSSVMSMNLHRHDDVQVSGVTVPHRPEDPGLVCTRELRAHLRRAQDLEGIPEIAAIESNGATAARASCPA